MVLGLGLLTKTTFLTAIAPVAVALLLPLQAGRTLRARLGDLGLAASGALAVSAWWYLLNHWTTGNWTGLYFNAGFRDWSVREAALSVDWPNAFKAIFSSHVWFGNWSFLKLRGWMYQVVMVAFAAGIIGAAIRLVRDFRHFAPNRFQLLIACLFYAFFWLGLSYYVLLTYVVTGVSATGGWYLYIPIACGLLVLFAGLALIAKPLATRVAAGTALLTTILDLYGVFFVLIPY